MATRVEQTEAVFKADDQGRAVMIRGAERIVLGAKAEIAEAMCAYLAAEDYGDRC
jgi:hypothetical protein